MCHAAEILLVLAPLTCPQQLLPTSPQKLLSEDSLTASEATGDYNRDATSRSTYPMFNWQNPCCMASSHPREALPYCRIDSHISTSYTKWECWRRLNKETI